MSSSVKNDPPIIGHLIAPSDVTAREGITSLSPDGGFLRQRHSAPAWVFPDAKTNFSGLWLQDLLSPPSQPHHIEGTKQSRCSNTFMIAVWQAILHFKAIYSGREKHHRRSVPDTKTYHPAFCMLIYHLRSAWYGNYRLKTPSSDQSQ